MIRGVQGAVALRRQRSRREDMNRRMTNASIDVGGYRTNAVSVRQNPANSRNSLFGVTFFHIGLVFLFIGFLMVITAMVPGYVKRTQTFDLVGTGTFFVVIGGVMTLINRAILRQEDTQLERYVTDRLSRSKSGCRLVRDDESGGLTPDIHINRHQRRLSRSPRIAEHASRDVAAASVVSPAHRPNRHQPHSHKNTAAVPETEALVGQTLAEIPEETNGATAVTRHTARSSTDSSGTPVKHGGARSGSPVAVHSPHTSHVARTSHVAHVHVATAPTTTGRGSASSDARAPANDASRV